MRRFLIVHIIFSIHNKTLVGLGGKVGNVTWRRRVRIRRLKRSVKNRRGLSGVQRARSRNDDSCTCSMCRHVGCISRFA
ncbi:hypothetical protein Hanom_Chr01g00038541 [Helianthus anomalus]